MFNPEVYRVSGLRDLCIDYGLDTHGSRDQLVNRIQNYLYKKAHVEAKEAYEAERFRQELLFKERLRAEIEHENLLIQQEIERVKAQAKAEAAALSHMMFEQAKREIEEEIKAKQYAEIEAHNQLLLAQAKAKAEHDEQLLRQKMERKNEDMLYRAQLLAKAMM